MHSLTTNPVRFSVKIQSSVFQVFIISILVWVNRGICGRVQRLYRALCRAVLWRRTQHSVGLLDSCGFFYLVHTCCFKTHSKSWKKAWKTLHVDACVLSQLWLKNHNKDQTSNQQQSFFFSRITWLVCSIMSDLYPPSLCNTYSQMQQEVLGTQMKQESQRNTACENTDLGWLKSN